MWHIVFLQEAEDMEVTKTLVNSDAVDASETQVADAEHETKAEISNDAGQSGDHADSEPAMESLSDEALNSEESQHASASSDNPLMDSAETDKSTLEPPPVKTETN